MAHPIRGALIEYGTDFLGPIPNVVIFQFNPESLTRNIEIPPRPTGAVAREASAAGLPPVEKFTLKVQFNAADALNSNNPLARTLGLGPQLAALEKMARPATKGLLGAALDAVGDALGLGGGSDPTQSIPREKYPRILFIWGLTRVLPVVIESLSITEQQYDSRLNPVQAEVSLGLAVVPPGACSDDTVGHGAFTYSETAKEAMAVLNLANTISQVADVIPF
jgi:hypothetical protein